jgi:hypothetical protein
MARCYPLEPLVKVRRERVDRRAAELGAAKRTRTREEAFAEVARARHEGARRRTLATQASERQRLEGGELRARDLAQGELHRLRAEAEIAALASDQAGAARRAKKAKGTEAAAQAALGRARAEHEATLRHRRRFHEEEARANERASEEAAQDHFLSLRQGARRG